MCSSNWILFPKNPGENSIKIWNHPLGPGGPVSRFSCCWIPDPSNDTGGHYHPCPSLLSRSLMTCNYSPIFLPSHKTNISHLQKEVARRCEFEIPETVGYMDWVSHSFTYSLTTYVEPIVLCFGGWTLKNKVFYNQNTGHLMGSKYV